MRATMNFPPQLQQAVEKWANRHGVSFEEFILMAVADKVTALDRQATSESVNIQNPPAESVESTQQPKVYRKEGILVVDAELPTNFDLNALIDELREERIQEQIAL